MKPFDLERAKAGDPVYDMNSKEVVHFIGVNSFGEYLIQRPLTAYYIRAADELRMAPKKRTVWVNLYPDGDAAYYPTKANACAASEFGETLPRIGGQAYPIEIEE